MTSHPVTRQTVTNYPELSQRWQALQGIAPALLGPIQSEEDLQRATEALFQLDRRMHAEGLPHPLQDLAELVMHRIMAYESEHHPIGPSNPASLLAFLLDQHGLTQQQLAAATGIAQTTISALLAKKRGFTAGHARKLAQHFGVRADLFIG